MSGVMTACEMMPALGAKVLVRFESLLIEAHINNVRFVWGKPQLQIAPVAGTGMQWVELGRIKALPETTMVPARRNS